MKYASYVPRWNKCRGFFLIPSYFYATLAQYFIFTEHPPISAPPPLDFPWEVFLFFTNIEFYYYYYCSTFSVCVGRFRDYVSDSLMAWWNFLKAQFVVFDMARYFTDG